MENIDNKDNTSGIKVAAKEVSPHDTAADEIKAQKRKMLIEEQTRIVINSVCAGNTTLFTVDL